MPLLGHEHRIWKLSSKRALVETCSRGSTLGQRDSSGEGTYGRTLADPAVWLGQKYLTGTDRRPGQDCPTSPSAKAQENEFPSTHSPSLQVHGAAHMW